jgi:hypothetical protein
MGFLDKFKFKKKKANKPVKALETPPGPDGELVTTSAPQGMPFPQATPAPQQTTPFGPQQGMLPPQTAGTPSPFTAPQSTPGPVPNMPQSSPAHAEFSMPPDHIQPNQMPDFSLPLGQFPGHRAEPEAMPFGEHPMGMPAPPEEDTLGSLQQHAPPGPQPLEHQQAGQPSFKFYQAATPEEVAAQNLESPIAHPSEHPEQNQAEHNPKYHVPFDVSQELLSLPGLNKHQTPSQEMPTFHKEDMQHAIHKKPAHHTPKQFITMTNLFEVGEQLVNFSEDLSLAKDTSFRIADLNEQEIEHMAKWHTLQESIQMRVAEIDKLLFRTKGGE